MIWPILPLSFSMCLLSLLHGAFTIPWLNIKNESFGASLVTYIRVLAVPLHGGGRSTILPGEGNLQVWKMFPMAQQRSTILARHLQILH